MKTAQRALRCVGRAVLTRMSCVCDVSVWCRAVGALSDAQREEIARLELLLGAVGR